MRLDILNWLVFRATDGVGWAPQCRPWLRDDSAEVSRPCPRLILRMSRRAKNIVGAKIDVQYAWAIRRAHNLRPLTRHACCVYQTLRGRAAR